MDQSQSLFHLFLYFQTNITIFTTNNVKKCPSSIWCWDSNPQPSGHESPPITTRPGLQRSIFGLNNFPSFSISNLPRFRQPHLRDDGRRGLLLPSRLDLVVREGKAAGPQHPAPAAKFQVIEMKANR